MKGDTQYKAVWQRITKSMLIYHSLLFYGPTCSIISGK